MFRDPKICRRIFIEVRCQELLRFPAQRHEKSVLKMELGLKVSRGNADQVSAFCAVLGNEVKMVSGNGQRSGIDRCPEPDQCSLNVFQTRNSL